jgi:peptide/nickel transport system ATP-binding protein
MEEKAVDLLKKVHLNPDCLYRYPHAFSGGQRQRLAIARALSLNPRFIVADEPVSALDVSVQAQILNLLKDLQSEFAFTCLFIAHDLSVIEYISDRIIIMYVGRIMEIGSNSSIFKLPGHPYTEALLSSVPKPNPKLEKQTLEIRGEIADPANPPGGCYFHPRCPYTKDICKKETPGLINISKDPNDPHYSSCHFAEELQLLGV